MATPKKKRATPKRGPTMQLYSFKGPPEWGVRIAAIGASLQRGATPGHTLRDADILRAIFATGLHASEEHEGPVRERAKPLPRKASNGAAPEVTG